MRLRRKNRQTSTSQTPATSKPVRYSEGKELVLDGERYIVRGYEDSAQVREAYIRLENQEGEIIPKSRTWVATLLEIDRRKETTP